MMKPTIMPMPLRPTVSDIADDNMSTAPTLTDTTMRSRSDFDSDNSPPHDSGAESEDDSGEDLEDVSDDDYVDICQKNIKDRRWARTVTIQAGRYKTPLILHTAPLVENSAWFRKVLALGRKVVPLVNIGALYLMMYAHWIYTSNLDFAALGYRQNGNDFVHYEGIKAIKVDDSNVVQYSEIETYSNRDRHLEKTSEWAHRLIVFWVHAEFLGDVRLQNTISEELENWWFKEDLVVSIHRRSFAFVGKHASLGSPLRKLCIDWADLSDVFRSREESQIEIERLPNWLSTRLLLMKIRRERGTLKEDPRGADLTRRGRYHVCCHKC